MRFHDGETDVRTVANFRGRLSDFRLTHDAELPPTPESADGRPLPLSLR